jgi:hypothetical protein
MDIRRLPVGETKLCIESSPCLGERGCEAQERSSYKKDSVARDCLPHNTKPVSGRLERGSDKEEHDEAKFVGPLTATSSRGGPLP